MATIKASTCRLERSRYNTTEAKTNLHRLTQLHSHLFSVKVFRRLNGTSSLNGHSLDHANERALRS